MYPALPRRPLDVFFTPKSVAVIGATERAGSAGQAVFANLQASQFGGPVYPVNPNHATILGAKCYAKVGAIPGQVDLAIVLTPAGTVPGVIRECVEAGVNGAVIISAGFKEAGARGVALEKEILAEARRSRIRIIGPNCLGVMAPWNGLNATFATALARPGHVALISQSGAICTAILDWSFRELVGFSAFVSVGSMLDVGWGDLIDHLGADPRTRSILLYMETIGDARPFLSAAREVALSKPIIVLKAGRAEAAARAAASHTGALAGSDEAIDAAFRRCGVLRVDRISDLFDMAEALDKQPRPRGPRLTIVTNAGGPGVLATDALLGEGGALADLAPGTVTALNEVLPPHWSHQNPIDIIGDAGPDRFAKAVEIVAKDPQSDGLLVALAPQGMTSPAEIAERLKPYAKLDGKPILASWMGGAEVAAGEAILNRAGIPTFSYPDTAARAFQYMWRYSESLRALYETPAYDSGLAASGPEEATRVIQNASKEARELLTEHESKRLLKAYGIPAVQTETASSEADAVEVASRIGYPVVLKLLSKTLTHKTDVGGVRLNLPDEHAVRTAYRDIERSVREKAGEGHFDGVSVQPMILDGGYELILGSSIDPQLGPVLLFGYGGQLVEVFRDHALGLPPLNTTLARRMMERTRIFQALKGVRGRKPLDLRALEELVVKFSQLIVEQRMIKEIEINPLLASANGLVALDARVVLQPAGLTEKELPKLAIRPYPSRYARPWTMKDGGCVTIRPIRPEDEPLMVEFHRTLSDESVYSRYFHMVGLKQRIQHDRLARVCFIDYDRETALVVERGTEGVREIIAVGRLTKIRESTAAEFAIIVSDRWQRRGLGAELLRRLIEIAGDEAIERIVGAILPENRSMETVSRRLGFTVSYDRQEGILKAILDVPARRPIEQPCAPEVG